MFYQLLFTLEISFSFPPHNRQSERVIESRKLFFSKKEKQEKQQEISRTYFIATTEHKAA